jgi:hypothetical protein
MDGKPVVGETFDGYLNDDALQEALRKYSRLEPVSAG